MEEMKLNGIKKIKDGKFLKNYELYYTNKAGKDKVYEFISHKEIESIDEIGEGMSGCSIVAIRDGKLLLLKEFRMAANRDIYNLCAGRIEAGETLEDCVRRELYEETGLELIGIREALPPAYAAVSLSDIRNQLVFADVKGELCSEHTSDNEQIIADFYTKDQVNVLLYNSAFSSRAQAIAYAFIHGALD